MVYNSVAIRAENCRISAYFYAKNLFEFDFLRKIRILIQCTIINSFVNKVKHLFVVSKNNFFTEMLAVRQAFICCI